MTTPDKPMQGLADWLRAVASKEALTGSREDAILFRQWAADVDAATPASAAETYADFQQRQGAPLTFFAAEATNYFQAAASRDDVSVYDAMVAALARLDELRGRVGISASEAAPEPTAEMNDAGLQALRDRGKMDFLRTPLDWRDMEAVYLAMRAADTRRCISCGGSGRAHILNNGTYRLGRCLGCDGTGVDVAPPAPQPAQNFLEQLKEYRCTFYQDEDGGLPLADLIAHALGDKDVGRAHEEMELLADFIEQPAPAPQPAGVVEALEALVSNEDHAVSGGIPRSYQIGSDTWQLWEDARAALASLPEQPIPAKPLTRQVLINMRSSAKSDPGCADEYWFIIFARAIEQAHGISAAPTQDTQGGGNA